MCIPPSTMEICKGMEELVGAGKSVWIRGKDGNLPPGFYQDLNVGSAIEFIPDGKQLVTCVEIATDIAALKVDPKILMFTDDAGMDHVVWREIRNSMVTERTFPAAEEHEARIKKKNFPWRYE